MGETRFFGGFPEITLGPSQVSTSVSEYPPGRSFFILSISMSDNTFKDFSCALTLNNGCGEGR